MQKKKVEKFVFLQINMNNEKNARKIKFKLIILVHSCNSYPFSIPDLVISDMN